MNDIAEPTIVFLFQRCNQLSVKTQDELIKVFVFYFQTNAKHKFLFKQDFWIPISKRLSYCGLILILYICYI